MPASRHKHLFRKPDVLFKVSQWNTWSPTNQNTFLMSINQCAFSHPVKCAKWCPLFSWRSICSILIFTIQTDITCSLIARTTNTLSFPLSLTLCLEGENCYKGTRTCWSRFFYILPSSRWAVRSRVVIYARIWNLFHRIKQTYGKSI